MLTIMLPAPTMRLVVIAPYFSMSLLHITHVKQHQENELTMTMGHIIDRCIHQYPSTGAVKIVLLEHF